MKYGTTIPLPTSVPKKTFINLLKTENFCIVLIKSKVEQLIVPLLCAISHADQLLFYPKALKALEGSMSFYPHLLLPMQSWITIIQNKQKQALFFDIWDCEDGLHSEAGQIG